MVLEGEALAVAGGNVRELAFKSDTQEAGPGDASKAARLMLHPSTVGPRGVPADLAAICGS